MQLEGHSIPRLHKLGYLEVALRQAAEGAPFERVRQALIAYAASDSNVLRGPQDPHAFWSPTQEALAELMRLKLIEQTPLPSERKYVDGYRASTYQLTSQGKDAAQNLSTGAPQDRAEFLDMLSIALVETHPGFAELLTMVEQDPLCIPEYTIEKVSSLAEQGQGMNRLAHDAVSRVVQHWPRDSGGPKVEDLMLSIDDALKRRFPPSRVPGPSQKDVLDTINDAVLSFAARARRVPLDAISFNVCMSWAGQLALLEESRYVEGWPGRTMWATAHIEQRQIRRRGYRKSTDAVVRVLADSFKQVADAMPEARASGYLPIYRVRAQAAFATRVNLRFVDVILGRAISGELLTPYTIRVALGAGTRPPPSEPVFTLGGRRFFEIMIIDRKESNNA